MKFTLYRAKDGWRWRLKSRNGRIVAESGESYRRRGDALKMMAKINPGFEVCVES